MGNKEQSICQECGRTLTNPESIHRKIGPVCWARSHPHQRKNSIDYEEAQARGQSVLFPSEGFDVSLKRDASGYISTNVPRRLVKHSPDGFEWGYGGSGPADLALNILTAFVGVNEAEILYQEFKRDFIACMPKMGGTIEATKIKQWIEERRTHAKQKA